MRTPVVACSLVVALTVACSSPPSDLDDAGTPDASTIDAGRADGGSAEVDAGSLPVKSGESCDEARVLTTPIVLEEETTSGLADDFHAGAAAGCDLSGSPGADRVYEIEVPAGQVLRASVTPAGSYDPFVALVAGPASSCTGASARCLTADDRGLESATNLVSWLNTGATTRVFVVVDSVAARGGTYRLEVSVEAPQAGDRCTGAPALDPGTTSDLSLTGFSDDYRWGEGCRGSLGPDRAWRITVPPGRALRATATPAAGVDVALDLVTRGANACEGLSPLCEASADLGGDGRAETVGWTNATTADADVFLIVEAEEATARFALDVTLVDPLPGDTCESAEELLPGTTAASLEGYANDYTVELADPVCVLSPSIADRVWQVFVDPGRTISLVVHPTDPAFDPAVSILTGTADQCGVHPQTCAASINARARGGDEELAWTNASGALEQAFILVDGSSGTTETGFTISLSLQ